MYITSKSPETRQGASEAAPATAKGAKRQTIAKRMLRSPNRLQGSPKLQQEHDSLDAYGASFGVVGQIVVAHQVPYINRKIEGPRNKNTRDASISPSHFTKGDTATLEETGTQRSVCHSAGTEADQTAHNQRDSSTLGVNVQGEKKNDNKGELEVNGSAYFNYLYVEKPLFNEKLSPKVVLKAAATTNTTPPDRTPTGELRS